MIFQPELAKLIKQSKKTMTRRQVHHDPQFGFARPCKYKPGHSYKVQPGRGQRGTFRITVTEVRKERFGEITLPDARREGFRTRTEFFDYWKQLYGRVDEEQLVWAITFILSDRYDHPQLLAANPGHLEFERVPGSQRIRVATLAEEHQDYTTELRLAMRDEPEGINGAGLDRITTAAAKRRQEDRKDEQVRARLRSLAIRLKDAARQHDLEAVVKIRRELEQLERDTGIAA